MDVGPNLLNEMLHKGGSDGCAASGIGTRCINCGLYQTKRISQMTGRLARTGVGGKLE